jgi:arabinose-5-phosphate isomerase
MKSAFNIIAQKKLGTLIVRNKKGNTTGIITDGQIRRISQKKEDLHKLKVKTLMTKNPIKVNKDTLVVKALSIMNQKKITCLCVNSSSNIKKTIGVIHIHNILENTID